MKKILLLTSLFLSQVALSQIVDVFNFTGFLNANGWATHSGTAGQMSTSVGSLSYPGLAASVGNSAIFAETSSEDLNKPITIAGDTAYLSFIISVDSTSDLSIGGDYFFGIGGSAGAAVNGLFARTYLRLGSAPNTFNFGIGNSSGAATYDVVDRPINTPIFVVISLDKFTSPSVAKMYVNPTPGAAIPSTSTITNTINAGAISAFAAVYLRQGGNTGNFKIDEIRAGSSYASVTPGLAVGCAITASGIASLTCNDATTPTVPSDDFLTFNLSPTGATLGANYTVSVSSGTITPTTGTYGSVTSFQLQAGSAGAGNVTVTLSDNATMACTFDQIITDPGACSSANPIVTLTPNSLTGFDHLVGTPSAEQTFTASGLGLLGNITITAPTNFQISTTTGVGFASTVILTQTGGAVATTTIYARANAAAAGALVGDIIATSSGAVNDTVMVSGLASTYMPYTIGQVSTVDANGVADSLNVFVELTGTIYCIDFDGNAGYSLTMIDGAGSGINLFSFVDVSNYSATEGDSLRVFGQIDQFNGLLEVVADSIVILSQGAALMSPTVVTSLSEATESQYIRMDNLTLVVPIATFPTGSTNLDVTDGTNTFVIRIDSDTDIPGGAAPQGVFSVIGVGGQFDSSSPFDEGYQLFPCGLASFIDGGVGLTENALLNSIQVYPNPVVDELTIKSSTNDVLTYVVSDVNGKIISSSNTFTGTSKVSTSLWEKGVYFVKFASVNGEAVMKIVK